MKHLLLLILTLSYNNTLIAKELIISEIKNIIENVDIYGNKFILNKNYIIKDGDFIKSKNQNSYFVFDNVKICLAKNSSIKFKEIKNNNVLLEHLKGNLLVNKINNKSFKFEISIFKNLIYDINGKVYINQFNKKAHHNSQLWYQAVIDWYVEQYGDLPSKVGPGKNIKLILDV